MARLRVLLTYLWQCFLAGVQNKPAPLPPEDPEAEAERKPDAPPFGVVHITVDELDGIKYRFGIHMEDMSRLTEAAKPFKHDPQPTDTREGRFSLECSSAEVQAIERVWLSSREVSGDFAAWFEVRAATPADQDVERVYLDREGQAYGFQRNNWKIGRGVQSFLMRQERARIHENKARIAAEQAAARKRAADALFADKEAT